MEERTAECYSSCHAENSYQEHGVPLTYVEEHPTEVTQDVDGESSGEMVRQSGQTEGYCSKKRRGDVNCCYGKEYLCGEALSKWVEDPDNHEVSKQSQQTWNRGKCESLLKVNDVPVVQRIFITIIMTRKILLSRENVFGK